MKCCRNKFGEYFVRAVVLGYLPYPDTELVVNTAVVLEPDRRNFHNLLDMWSNQVNTYCEPREKAAINHLNEYLQAGQYRLGKYRFTSDNFLVRELRWAPAWVAPHLDPGPSIQASPTVSGHRWSVIA